MPLCFFSNAVAVFGAQCHHRGHVHLVEGGQHRGGVLCLLQPCGDRSPQARHAHALFAWLRFTHRFRHRGSGRRRGTVEKREHVTLGDAAILATALADLFGREMLFLDQLGGSRQWCVSCDIRRRRGWTRDRPERARRRVHPGLWHCCRTRRRWWRGPRRGLGCGSCSAYPRFQQAEQRADRYLAALRRTDRRQHAGRRCVDLHRHLVGFQLHQRLVSSDRLALVLHPACHGGRCDALAQSRDVDLGCHRHAVPSAAATSAACSAPCARAEPVAGLAAAARPT